MNFTCKRVNDQNDHQAKNETKVQQLGIKIGPIHYYSFLLRSAELCKARGKILDSNVGSNDCLGISLLCVVQYGQKYCTYEKNKSTSSSQAGPFLGEVGLG